MFRRLKALWAGTRPGAPLRDEGDVARAQAAEARSASAVAHLAAGRTRFEAGDYAAAVQWLERAIEAEHDFPEAHYLLALAHKELGERDGARDCLVLATHFRPGFAEAHFQLGVLAEERGDYADAIEYYGRAVAADDGFAEAYSARGAARVETGELEAAVGDFRRAIDLKPDFAAAHSNLGCVLLMHLDRFEEGAAHIETAWRLAPDNLDVQVNWAMLLQHRGRLAESLALWNRLIDSGMNVHYAKLNRAMLRLKQGEFALGWEDYESRKYLAKEHAQRKFPFPEWNGDPLADRTVLVYAEQGLGDQIMFASCIPELARLAGKCVVECAPKLKALFTRSFPTVTVVSAQESVAAERRLPQTPATDRYVALGSLPRHFRNSPERFPVHRGYLRADPGKVAEWRKRLDALPGARAVGISWRGGLAPTRRSVRSLPLKDWGPILGEREVDFVSLQYTDCQDELAQLARETGVHVHHWQDAIDDYDQTAALVCALDLVVSVQTSVVHLAGALGRPVWVMLPAVSEWRYLELDGRVPWYPSMRLFRQAELGNWAPLTEQIARELARFQPR
jgi:tetratricopeptide (TPR) repeat protein